MNPGYRVLWNRWRVVTHLDRLSQTEAEIIGTTCESKTLEDNHSRHAGIKRSQLLCLRTYTSADTLPNGSGNRSMNSQLSPNNNANTSHESPLAADSKPISVFPALDTSELSRALEIATTWIVSQTTIKAICASRCDTNAPSTEILSHAQKHVPGPQTDTRWTTPLSSHYNPQCSALPRGCRSSFDHTIT